MLYSRKFHQCFWDKRQSSIPFLAESNFKILRKFHEKLCGLFPPKRVHVTYNMNGSTYSEYFLTNRVYNAGDTFTIDQHTFSVFRSKFFGFGVQWLILSYTGEKYGLQG